MEIKLNTKETGSGKPVTVFIHGWAQSSAAWNDVFKQWPATTGRAIAFDLRGAGKSAKPEKGYSLEEHAKDVIHTIRSLDLKEVSLVGHSMGGTIAQLVAIEAPELIKKLILVNPVPASGVPLPPEAVDFFRAAAGNPEVCKQIFTSSMTIKPSAEKLNEMAATAETVSSPAILEGLDAWRNASFAQRLNEIKCPVTLLSGDADPYLSVDFLKQAVADPIAGTKIRWIKGAGHYPHIESTDAFVGALFE